MTSYIDLTHTIDKKTLAYPGDPQIFVEPATTVELDGFAVHKIAMGTHAGTHVDAPAHMIDNARPLSAFALEDFMGEAVALDCTNFVRDGEISANVVEQVESEQLDWVILYTGQSRLWQSAEYFSSNIAVPSEKLLARMAGMRLKGFGLDACGPDRPGEDLRHKLWFEASHGLIVENLANVEMLLGRRFFFFALPLKTSAKDGSPVRAFGRM